MHDNKIIPFSRMYEERIKNERLPIVKEQLNVLLALIDRAEKGERFAKMWLEGRGANAHERVAQLMQELAQLELNDE